MTSNKKRVSALRLVLIIFTLLTVWSCLAYKYVTPYQKFDHDKHENAIMSENKDCFTCHKVDIKEKDPLKRLELLKTMLKEADDKRFDGEQCHVCHIDELTKRADASNRCALCHENLNEIIPLDHLGLWASAHGTDTQVTDKTCFSCHDRWYCADCHTVRDMSRAKMHPKTFKIAHVAAAISDPASCSSCHRSAFCADCHSK